MFEFLTLQNLEKWLNWIYGFLNLLLLSYLKQKIWVVAEIEELRFLGASFLDAQTGN